MNTSRRSRSGFNRRAIALALGVLLVAAVLPTAAAQAVPAREAAGANIAIPASILPVQTPTVSPATAAALTATPATTSSSADPIVAGYITRVYADLFGRGVDPDGLATWSAQLVLRVVSG